MNDKDKCLAKLESGFSEETKKRLAKIKYLSNENRKPKTLGRRSKSPKEKMVTLRQKNNVVHIPAKFLVKLLKEIGEL